MQSKNKILLPKPHISFSQLTLWERSPETYKKRYILGEKGFTSKQMKFGKDFAEELEAPQNANFASTAIISKMRVYPQKEVEVSATMPFLAKNTLLLGVLDGYDKKTDELGEYKTGVTKWTQKLVDENDQITFYNLIKWLSVKKLYKKNVLHWVQTVIDEKGQVQFTGQIVSHETSRKITDVLKMKKRIEKFIIGVSQTMQEEINKI